LLDRLQSPILTVGVTTLFPSALLLLALLDQSPGHERRLRLLEEVAARSQEEHYFLSETIDVALAYVRLGETQNRALRHGAAELEVYWPTSSRTQKFPGVGLGARYVPREGAARLETLPNPAP
jgi:hypothetical protein